MLKEYYCDYCSQTLKFEKQVRFAIHRSACKLNPKNLDGSRGKRAIERALLKNPISAYTFNCKKCNEEYKLDLKLSDYNKGSYKKCCSYKCSNSREQTDEIKLRKSISAKNSDKVREASKERQGFYYKKIGIKEISKNKEETYKIIKIKSKLKELNCRLCGQENCDIKYFCNKTVQIKTLIKYFGFNKDVLGTSNFYSEIFKIKKELKTQYFIDNKSTNDLKTKYKCSNQTVGNMLRFLNIKLRPNIGVSNKYKQGYHKTWNNKKVFYRSSYELDYCILLDNQKINYEMENLRIPYFDTLTNKHRISIPDFYLPNTNTIIEIKGTHTLNTQNMKDRFKAYKNLGFNFKLILNKKEIIL